MLRTLTKGDIYAVTNIAKETIMYIQIFILVKAAFFLAGIQRSSLIIKKTEQSMKLPKNLVIIAKSL